MNVNTPSLQPKPYTSLDNAISSEPDTPINLKRKLEALTFADTETTKLPKSSTAEIPEGQIIERSVTNVNHHSHSAINNPDRTWHHCFTQIYKDLMDYDKNEIEYENSMDNDAPNLEQQLYLLTKDQVKSLLIAKAPDWLKKNHQSRYSSIPEAAGESEGGIIFFRFLFDRLNTEELEEVLLESVNGDRTLLHHAVLVMESSLFEQLQHKLGMKTLLEMLTRPVNDHAPPLAHACLYHEHTYVFDTAINHNKELIVKLLKGSPDIDESILQFMLGDKGSDVFRYCRRYNYTQRIGHLLNPLNNQERFDAVRFTGKNNMSPMLLACKNGQHAKIYKSLLKTLNDDQIVELFTAGAETNNSLLQKCLEMDSKYKADKVFKSIQSPPLRFKVMTLSTSQGNSVFQQLVHNFKNDSIEKIKHLLIGMNGSQRDHLITGDPNIWNQTTQSTDLTLRQQEQTPIADVINRQEMLLARYLWSQISEPVVRSNLLFYRPKQQTSLFQYMLKNDRQWLDDLLARTHKKSERDVLAAQLFQYESAAGNMNDGDYYLRQVSNPQLITKLLQDNHKYYLANLCKHGEEITVDHFKDITPPQCTNSIVYVLEQSLSKKYLNENLSQLMTAQEKAGDKDAFVKWALNPLHGKQSPLCRVLKRFAEAYCMRDLPEDTLAAKMVKPIQYCPAEIVEKGFTQEILQEFLHREIRLNKQLFQRMISMMSAEQIKEHLLPELARRDNIHLLGYKDILTTITGSLGDSGQATLETINPTTGENLLHIIFQNHLLHQSSEKPYIMPNDLIDTISWLAKTYGLTSFLNNHLESDGSTPLHVLLNTAKETRIDLRDMYKAQNQILEYLCQTDVDHILLVELLQLRDHNGCTPLHNLFSFARTNEEIADLLIKELGDKTWYELIAIKDKQGETALEHLSTLSSRSYEKYNTLFENFRSLFTVPVEINQQ